MKRYLLLLLALPFLQTLQAQTTIPNLDLEQWTDFNTYMEPSGGYWTTANKIVDLSSFYPETTTRSTDAHGGMYSARLQTHLVNIIVANTLVTGTLATGEFNAAALPPNNLKRGKPYTARPDEFAGWYKFTSVQGDSCAMYAWLHKWNSTTNERDTIGFAGLFPDQSVNSWTEFVLPIDYKSSDNPDSISIVFASSAAGELFQGQDGNTLWVDDLEMRTATGIPAVLMPEVAVKVYPNPASQKVFLELDKPFKGAVVEVYNQLGAQMSIQNATGTQIEVPVTDFPEGVYHYVIRQNGSALNAGTFLVR